MDIYYCFKCKHKFSPIGHNVKVCPYCGSHEVENIG